MTLGLFEDSALVRYIWSVGLADGSGRGVEVGLVVGVGVAVGVGVGSVTWKIGPFATGLTSNADTAAEDKAMMKQERSKIIESIPVILELAFIQSTMMGAFLLSVISVGCIYNFAKYPRPEKCLITEQVVAGLIGC